MDNKKRNIILLIGAVIVCYFFLNGGPESIEEQVEELIEEKDYSERKKIAYALADSLDNRAADLLIGSSSLPYPTSVYSRKALEDMLRRYSEKGRFTYNEISPCISYITAINPKHSIGSEDKIDLIIYGLSLDTTSLDFRKALANSPIIDDVISYLSDRMTDDKNAIELLARIGQPAVESIKIKMSDDDQSIRFAAGDVLVNMLKYYPNAVPNLTSAIDKNGVSTIAKNYPFYIRLGQKNTEKILLKALDRHFTTDMCVDYLNCGNKKVEDGAESIANKKGYMVTPSFSHSGPKWGSGN